MDVDLLIFNVWTQLRDKPRNQVTERHGAEQECDWPWQHQVHGVAKKGPKMLSLWWVEKGTFVCNTFLKLRGFKAGERTQRLRPLTALAEDLDSVPAPA